MPGKRIPLEEPPKPQRRNINILNPRQKRFCHEYVVDHNASQAAIRSGYSKKTAGVAGCQLLKLVKVHDYIRELEADLLDQVGLTAGRVKEEMFALGTSNLAQAFDERGNLLHPHDMPLTLQRALKKFKVVTVTKAIKGEPALIEYVTEVELYDKLGTIRLGAQMHGLVKPEDSGIQTHEIIIKGGLPT